MFSFNLNNVPTAGGYLSMYNTLINYKWSTTVKDNITYLKNFGASKYDAEMNSGKGIKFNGVDQQIKVPMPYILVGDLVCNYTGTETYDGTQGDWSSKYNQYIDVKPYTSYRFTVNIVSANNIAYAGIRFGSAPWTTFDRYGITGIGEQEFVFTSSDETHVYTRWFVRSDFVGEFGVTQMQEIQQDKLNILYTDGNGNLVQDTNTVPLLSYVAKTGTVKDLYIFTDTLTDAEITKCSLQPNEFFQDVRDGVIDNCILNMPMESITGHVRDYASDYTIGNELSGNVNFDDGSWWEFNGGVSVSNGQLVINPNNDFDNIQKTNYFPTNVPILIKIKLDECDSFNDSGIRLGGKFTSFINLGITSLGVSYIITTFTGGSVNAWGKKGYVTKIDYISFKQVSGVYPIENYSTNCINNTSQLNYGSQELKFLKDGLWRGNISSYLETAQGLAKTGWTPTGVFQVEEVVVIGGVSTHYVYDDSLNKFTNGAADGTYTAVTSEVFLDDTTFDGVSGVTTYRLFKVHTKPQDPLKLYNKAQQKGLLS